MITKDQYSSKDSNHNRIVDLRLSNRYTQIVIAALALFGGMFLYYNYMLLPDRPIKVDPSPSMLEPTPPPPSAYPHGQAKPYDVNKPPYEQ